MRKQKKDKIFGRLAQQWDSRGFKYDIILFLTCDGTTSIHFVQRSAFCNETNLLYKFALFTITEE